MTTLLYPLQLVSLEGYLIVMMQKKQNLLSLHILACNSAKKHIFEIQQKAFLPNAP